MTAQLLLMAPQEPENEPTKLSKWTRVKGWAKEHKKEIIATTVVVAGAIAAAVVINNQNDRINELEDENDLLGDILNITIQENERLEESSLDLLDELADAESAAFEYQQELEGLYDEYDWMNGGKGL